MARQRRAWLEDSNDGASASVTSFDSAKRKSRGTLRLAQNSAGER